MMFPRQRSDLPQKFVKQTPAQKKRKISENFDTSSIPTTSFYDDVDIPFSEKEGNVNITVNIPDHEYCVQGLHPSSSSRTRSFPICVENNCSKKRKQINDLLEGVAQLSEKIRHLEAENEGLNESAKDKNLRTTILKRMIF